MPGTQEIRTAPPIELWIDVPVPAAEAWRTITDPERIALWFTDASPLGSVGSRYRLDFGDGSVVRGRVTRLDPGRSFAHTWSWEGGETEQETEVTWSVIPAGAGSRIELTHTGWADADESARADHAAYWSGYLDDLREVLTED